MKRSRTPPGLMPHASAFKVHADFCTVMANEKRLRILWLLGARGEMSVGDIAVDIGTSISNASQHLRIMRSQKAVLTRKQGQTVHCRISNPTFFEGCRKVHQGLVEIHAVDATSLPKSATTPVHRPTTGPGGSAKRRSRT